MREHQPEAVVFAGTQPDVRWSGSEGGWASSPLWNVVSRGDGPQHWLGPDDFGYVPAEANLHTRSTWFWVENSDHTLVTVERLMQAHDESIGRGANLLVNMTPDTRGLIPEVEARRLAEFGEELRRQFDRPLAQTSSSDGWTADAALELELDSRQTVDHLVIEEDLGQGQRVVSFAIDVRTDGQWRSLAKGQSIGRRLVQRFAPVQTDRIRLRVTRAVGVPVIRTLSAYRETP